LPEHEHLGEPADVMAINHLEKTMTRRNIHHGRYRYVMRKTFGLTCFLLTVLSKADGLLAVQIISMRIANRLVSPNPSTHSQPYMGRMRGRWGHLRPRLWSQNISEEDSSSTSLQASVKFKNFEEMLGAFRENLILVNFHASWCGPCKLMKKELAEVSDIVGDRVKLFTVDTDRWPKLGARYEISGLPTIVIFKDGEICDRFEGVEKAEDLVRRLETIMVDYNIT